MESGGPLTECQLWSLARMEGMNHGIVIGFIAGLICAAMIAVSVFGIPH